MPSLPSPSQAWQRIEPRLRPLPPERVDLAAALGCTAAVDVKARWDHPRADLSAMDGYAYRGDAEAGASLREVAEIAAGDAGDTKLEQVGAAVAIMTGGWVPDGADRVVPFENTSSLGQGRQRLDRPVDAGANIRRRGEVYRAGEILLPRGTVLDAVHLALAAAEGHASLEATRRPRVGLLVTGNEVRNAVDGSDLPPGALLDSHTPMVDGLCAGIGLDLQPLGVASDSGDELAERLAIDDVDVLITTGGVSAGRYDLVPDAATGVGFETIVHRVAMQPGKPVLIARRERGQDRTQWLVGLPGNPAAVLVGFHLFVVPLLRALGGGGTEWRHGWLTVALDEPVQPHAQRTRYLPATLTPGGGGARVRAPVGSHDLRPFAGADILLEVEPGERSLPAGTEAPAIPLLKL